VNSRLRTRLATLFRHRMKYRSPQVLPYPPLINRDVGNSLKIRSYANCRASLGSPNIPTLKPPNPSAFFDLSLLLSNSCALFCAFLQPSKTQPFCFHVIPHSASKNREAWETSTQFGSRIKMNQPVTDSCSTSTASVRLHRQTTSAETSRYPRFVSRTPSFLVNYIVPILHRDGLREHLPFSTRGPRS
jgi:hypothetical protein